jgi:hypothetical protein
MVNVFLPEKMAIGVNVKVDIQAKTAHQKMKVFINCTQKQNKHYLLKIILKIMQKFQTFSDFEVYFNYRAINSFWNSFDLLDIVWLLLWTVSHTERIFV